jgi:hypothetical protein
MSIPRSEILLSQFRNQAQKFLLARMRHRAMSLPFSADAPARLLLVTQPERIPQSQIFPFHHFSGDMKKHYAAEVREADMAQILAGAPLIAKGATTVAFQTPFDISDADLHRLHDRLRDENPGATFAYLDWFAPTDLRNAARIGPLVDVYVKKHVLRDRAAYGQPTLGDTNLTDYYLRRMGRTGPVQKFDVSQDFLAKLVVGPSFATAPGILQSFLRAPPRHGPRPYDVHARFAVNGTDWYHVMRSEADVAVSGLKDLSILRGEGVSLPRFMAEMRRTKICFSPFGYGEVCWRDYEAIMGGAVLLKPDMSHIETDPDIFRAWETYVPLRWDLADFDEAVARLRDDEALRRRISGKAFAVLQDWLRSDAFAKVMAPLFP